MTTTIELDQATYEIETDLTRAIETHRPWEDPTSGLPVEAGLRAGRRAQAALTEVLSALGDLDPGPALIITDAIQRGLQVRP